MNPHSFHGQTGCLPYFWFLFRVVTNCNLRLSRSINYPTNGPIFMYSLASDIITFTLAARIVVASWMLMGTVFVNCYTSSLLSYLMAPKFLPLISTVQDLADSRDILIAVPKHTSVDSALFVIKSRFR